MSHRIALTGAGGFLGWHSRCASRAEGVDATAVAVGERFDRDSAVDSIDGSTRLVHVAGVNRGTDDQIQSGNIQFAEQIADALRRAVTPPPTVVFANSIQSTGDSTYGVSKRRAGEILARAASDVGAEFVDVALPNLFGEHGRPDYNSVFATFSARVAAGVPLTVAVDREIPLLHVQNAADVLLGYRDLEAMDDVVVPISVSDLALLLGEMGATYRRGEIPDVATPFLRDVFNGYRSYTLPGSIPISLTRHADQRGSFFELVKSHGGDGQTSFSTTVPGVSRGDHFHRRKIERFVVVAGVGEIALRKLFSDEIIRIPVSGDAPVAIDMPTMWSHNITNTGDGTLYTAFWTNDLFDPSAPDTIAEAV